MTLPHTLVIERDIAASPDIVWRCWTEEALLRQWFAPRPVDVTKAEIDPRPGGGFATIMEVPGHGTMAGDPGCVLLAEPSRRLVWTNALGPDFRPNHIGAEPGEFAFTADIRMEPSDTGCRYTATVSHATEAAKSAHEAMGFFDGWGAAAGQLGELAASL